MCVLSSPIPPPPISLIGSLNLRGRADCSKSKEEEQGFASTDTPTEEENGYGERLGLLVKEVGDAE